MAHTSTPTFSKTPTSTSTHTPNYTPTITLTPTPSTPRITDGKLLLEISILGNDSYLQPDVFTINADGTDFKNLTNNPTSNDGPAYWSPDGRWIAYNPNTNLGSQIFVMDAAGANSRQVTNIEAGAILSGWSPDGTKLLFIAETHSNPNYGFQFVDLYEVNLDGSELKKTQRVYHSLELNDPTRTPPKNIVFEENDLLYLADEQGNKVPLQYESKVRARGQPRRPLLSPDGTMYAFVALCRAALGCGTTSTGDAKYYGIFVVERSNATTRYIATTDEISGEIVWSPDNTRLAFIASNDGYAENNKLYSIQIDGTWETLLWQPPDKKLFFIDSNANSLAWQP